MSEQSGSPSTRSAGDYVGPQTLCDSYWNRDGTGQCVGCGLSETAHADEGATEPPRISWPMLSVAIRDDDLSNDDLGAMLRLWAAQGD